MAKRRKITAQAKQYLGEDSKRALTTDNSNQDKRNENICLLYAQGMPITEIGQLYCISRQRVSQILYSLGVSAKETKKESIDIRELEEWKAKAEKYRARARKNRELVTAYSLEVMGLKTKLELRNKKIEKLEKEIAELKSRKEV